MNTSPTLDHQQRAFHLRADAIYSLITSVVCSLALSKIFTDFATWCQPYLLLIGALVAILLIRAVAGVVSFVLTYGPE